MFNHIYRGLIALLERTHLAIVPARPRRQPKRRWTARPQLETLPSRILPSVDIWTGAGFNSNDPNDNLYWSVGQNWSLGAAPGTGDIAEFTNAPGNGVVNVNSVDDATSTIGGLQIDGTWNGTLTVGTNNNPVTLTLASGSSNEWDGGTISLDLSDGSLVNEGALTQNSFNDVYLEGGGAFTNDGTIDQTNTGYLYMIGTSSVASTLSNSSGAIINLQNNGIVSDPNSAGGAVTNSGAINVNAGTGNTALIKSPLTNTGSMNISSGTLAFEGNTNDTNGTFNLSSGAVLNLAVNDNDIFEESGTFTATGSGEILWTSGQFGSTLTTGSAGATFNLSNSTVFDWSVGSINIPVGATLTFNGNLTANVGSSGTVFFEGGGSFVNNGTFTLTGGGEMRMDADTLVNSLGSTIDFQADNSIVPGPYTAGAITNAGTIEKTGGTGISAIEVDLTTSGTLDAASGTLQLAAPTNATNGTYEAAAGATIQLTNPSYQTSPFTESGTFTASGSGTITMGGGVFDVNNAVTLNIASGTTFIWTASSVGYGIDMPNSSDTLTVNGNLLLTGGTEYLTGNGTMTENGTMTQSGDGHLQLSVNSNIPTLIISSNSVFNFGAGGGIVSYFGDGVVDNSGTINKTGSGTADINAAFNNLGGTLYVSKGTLTLDSTGGVSTGGTFDVSSGAILDLTGGQTTTYAGTYTGTGTGEVELDSGTLSVAGGSSGATFNLPGGLFVWTGGTIDTNGNNMTILGNLNINGSTNTEHLNSGNSSGGNLYIGSTTKTGALKETSDGNTLSIATGTTLQIQSKGTLDLADDTITGSGAVVNLGSLIKNTGTSTATISTFLDNQKTVEVETGTLTLSGTVNQVSGNALTGGTWEAVNAKAIAALNISSASFATIDPGVTVEVSGPYASFANLSAVTTNEGSLSILGGASVSTSGNFTNSGTLTLTGSTTLNSVLNIGGTFTQTGLGTLNVNFSGTAAAPTYGVINSTGAASLAGTLKVTSKIKPSTNIDIISYGSETGDFAHKTLPSGWSAAPGSTDYVLTP